MKNKKKATTLAHIEWRNSSARIIFYHKGERFVRSLGVISEDAADIARLQFVVDVKSGKVLPQSNRATVPNEEMTFAQFTILWLKDREKTVSAKMFHEDNRRLESRILPVLGSKILASLTGYDLDQYIKITLAEPWQNDLKSFKALGDQSRKHYFRQLYRMLKQAKAWGYLSHNPMEGLTAPSAKNKATEYYSIEELANFWKMFSHTCSQRALVIHLAWTLGLRREEISGLRWSDLDLENLTATIQNCRLYIPGHSTISKGTKNGEIRTVGLTPQVSEMLKCYKTDYDKYQSALGKKWLGQDLVFVKLNDKGQPYSPSSIDHWLDEYLNKNELPHITLHGFRHTMATLLNEAGMDTVTVSELLGHATKQSSVLGGYGMAPRVTRTYLHKSKDASKKMTEIMTEIFDQVMLLKPESSQTSSHVN
ncbi:Tyrosine recombinase XerC [Sporomusa silvacetica DSM 10669]|uniref:Tyrosine recombinase XerC n=1 Tax=Sporomusa silvacetica DSM 10669 TaxID=1123289 RepID=A0ABZ3IUE5_9FIRM|nr:site-specific integrase [Sporomusa silvacetica]OZC19637.1 tyrosine recombinase XerC [Sporomusa silvacetica DSM 10669]